MREVVSKVMVMDSSNTRAHYIRDLKDHAMVRKLEERWKNTVARGRDPRGG